MTQDHLARVERLERAAREARRHIDNPPPIMHVEYIDSDGEGGIAAEQSTAGNYTIDPLRDVLKAHHQRLQAKGRATR